MEAQPDNTGVPGMDHEENPAFARPQQAGAGQDEDWLSLATSDPAFWLKESERD